MKILKKEHEKREIMKTSKNDNQPTTTIYNYSENSAVEHYNGDNEQF